MKPVQIGLLVAVGAIGGALVMKMTSQRSAEPTVVAISQPAHPAPSPAEAVPPAPEPANTSPVEVTVQPEKPKTQRVVRKQPAPKPRVVESAKVVPPPAVVAAPEPVISTPAPAAPPAPPVREPEIETPAPKPPEPHRITLNAGILLPVRIVDGLSSERNLPGDTFTATLDKELVVDGFVIAERGARAEGKVVASERAGKVKGVSSLAVELTRLRTADGQNIAIRTDSFERQGPESHTQDAAKVGGGAALGAIIGAIAGGGKGAAIGAGAGGAAGAGGVLLTRGKPVTLPSETRINFRLSASVTVTERR